MRRAKTLTCSPSRGPGTKRKPATSTDTAKPSMPKPIPAILPTTVPAAFSSGGPKRFTAASRLTEARLHAAWTFSPITGHSRTDSGGRGTVTVWFSKSETRFTVVSATLTVTAPSGTTTTSEAQQRDDGRRQPAAAAEKPAQPARRPDRAPPRG